MLTTTKLNQNVPTTKKNKNITDKTPNGKTAVEIVNSFFPKMNGQNGQTDWNFFMKQLNFWQITSNV